MRAGEAGEVDDADGVRERELGGWGTVNLLQRIEVAWVVPAEVVEGLLDNILDLVLVPETDAGGHGVVCRVRGREETKSDRAVEEDCCALHLDSAPGMNTRSSSLRSSGVSERWTSRGLSLALASSESMWRSTGERLARRPL